MFYITLINVIEVLLLIIPVLMTVAFITIAERKTMASMQRRLGPNIVGYYGLLQAFADALKLLIKEYVYPTQANIILFFIGPLITLLFSLYGYAMIPYGPGISIYDFNFGLLYMLIVSSLSTYGILLAGWSANSKYAFLGSLRSTAQLISYELILSSALLLIVLLTGTLNLSVIVEMQKAIWFILPLFPLFYIFFSIINTIITNLNSFILSIITISDTTLSNNTFNLLFIINNIKETFNYNQYVSNIITNTEYDLDNFKEKLYLFNNTNIITDTINNISNNPIWFSLMYALGISIKTIILIFSFIWVRASFPRIRYDQLMSFCWTKLLPLIIGIIIIIPCIIYFKESILFNIWLL